MGVEKKMEGRVRRKRKILAVAVRVLGRVVFVLNMEREGKER